MKKTSQKKLNRGFTLIELLIVIGILAVLAVIALLALNPGEAQKKSRDTARVKDIGTLQAIIQQYLDDGNPTFCTSGCTSDKTKTTCGSAGWLGIDICKYTTKVPVDPLNGQTRTVQRSGTSSDAQTLRYHVGMDTGGNYVVCVKQEADANNSKLDTTAISWMVAKSGTPTTSCP